VLDFVQYLLEQEEGQQPVRRPGVGRPQPLVGQRLVVGGEQRGRRPVAPFGKRSAELAMLIVSHFERALKSGGGRIIDRADQARNIARCRRLGAAFGQAAAGLIRSIDYSATAALDRALNVGPDEQGKLAAALSEWRDRAMAAFLGAYRETMTDPLLWPAEPLAAEQMLNFFLLEKAIYEIDYELAHRPDWLRVPLTGALRILAQPPQQSLQTNEAV